MINEEKIFINYDELIIETLICKSSSKRGVIICHPHPLMGGSMYNNVVETLVSVFAKQDFTTLRFNFRGVGESTGNYDEGNGESDDIIAAYQYLRMRELSQIYFAGYSFGAWVGAKAMEKSNEKFFYSLFIAPPDNYFHFNFESLQDKLNLIICGDRDEFCDNINIQKKAKEINAKVEIINEADHFFWGKEKEIENILLKYIIK